MDQHCVLEHSLGRLLDLTATPGNSDHSVELLASSLEKCRVCNAQGCPGLGMALIETMVERAQAEYHLANTDVQVRRASETPRVSAA